MDVDDRAVEEAFRHARVTQMIHGHTHRRGMHCHRIDGQEAWRFVLGDWHEGGNALRATATGLQPLDLPG